MSFPVTIDRSGRVVIPKSLRERMKFSPGAKLQAEIVGDKLELVLAPVELSLVKKGKRRVVVGGDAFDAGPAVREAREDHLDRIHPKQNR